MNVEIAQRLAELRRDKGYSQEELAEKLGLSRQAVSKWERAESSPDTGNLVALAKHYGVTLDELLRFDDEIEEDMLFETQDRSVSAEAKAQEAAEKASIAAAQATAAAAQIQAEQAAARVAQGHYAGQAPHTPTPPAQSWEDAYVAQEKQNILNEQAGHGRSKGPWSSFPYPIVCVIVFLLAGFFFGSWHPAWVVFLTVPLYYWIAHIIETDPNYRK
ncbi:MAG: helix-turn-helix transcriptional regulator [Raoultibacter sp.]